MSYKNVKVNDGYVRVYDNGDIRSTNGTLLGYVKSNGDIVSKSNQIQSGYVTKSGEVRIKGSAVGKVNENGDYRSYDGSTYTTSK